MMRKSVFYGLALCLLAVAAWAAVDTFEGQTGTDTWEGVSTTDTREGQTVAGGEPGGDMAYVQLATGTTASGPTTATLSATATAGNRLVALVWKDSASAPSTPTGFTVHGTAVSDAATDRGVSVMSKVSDGSETGIEFDGRSVLLYELPASSYELYEETEVAASVTDTLTIGPTAALSTSPAFVVVGIVGSTTVTIVSVTEGYTLDYTDSSRRFGYGREVETTSAITVDHEVNLADARGGFVAVFVAD